MLHVGRDRTARTGRVETSCTEGKARKGVGVLGSDFFAISHFILRCLRYRFRTERLHLRTMTLLNLKGATVIDIGANRGIYCFWMVRAVGSNGRVIAFEPQPEMHDTIA